MATATTKGKQGAKPATAKNDPSSWYNQLANVPQDATQPIKGGRLNGFTAINGMWRIQKLTEVFGPFGIGWYTEILEESTIPAVLGDESLVKIKLALYVKVGEKDGEVIYSKPAVGYGTAKLIAVERSGARLDDDAYKKAMTDALSNAGKMFGLGGSVYYASAGFEDNKYIGRDNEAEYVPVPIMPVGQALEPAEQITAEQSNHLLAVLTANGKELASVLGYVNAMPSRKDRKATAVTDFTYEEYVQVLGFFRQ